MDVMQTNTGGVIAHNEKILASNLDSEETKSDVIPTPGSTTNCHRKRNQNLRHYGENTVWNYGALRQETDISEDEFSMKERITGGQKNLARLNTRVSSEELGDKSNTRSRDGRNDPMCEKMETFYSTMDELISEFKNTLSTGKPPCKDSKKINVEKDENQPELRPFPASLSHFTTHGDQAKSLESRAGSPDLIDFVTEMESKDSTHNQQLNIKDFEDMLHSTEANDIESEVQKSVNEATMEVEKIGDIIRSVSKAVQDSPNTPSPTIATDIGKVMQLVKNLERKIPENVELLNYLPETEKTRCQRAWRVISTELDAMTVLANAIQHSLAS